MIPLSVLDLSFVSADSTPAQALHDTLALARHVDGLGYRRYWLAEHHNMPGIACPAPEIVIAAVARDKTPSVSARAGSCCRTTPRSRSRRPSKCWRRSIRGGSIWGLAARPGTDGVTARALRRREAPGAAGGDDFLDRLQELLFWDGGFPEGHPFARIEASPAGVPLPPIFLLGSSDYSARLAGEIGCGFGFAQHFSGDAGRGADARLPPSVPADAARREAPRDPGGRGDLRRHGCARPSAWRPARGSRPCGGSGASTGRCRASPRRWPTRILTPSGCRSRAAATGFHVGGPETLRARLADMVARTQADELMVVTAIPDQAARHGWPSALLAQAWGLGATSQAA